MASASVTITFTDTATVTLVQARDKLLVKWNYLSGGGVKADGTPFWVPLNTNQDKLNFIQAVISRWVKQQTVEQFQIELDAANQALDVNIA